MRTYVIGSLVGHLTLTLVGALLTQALHRPPPPSNLIRVGLMEIEPVRTQPVEQPRPTPEPPRPQPVEEPEPTPVESPKPIPKPPAEVKRPEREVVPERIADEPEPAPLELHPPDTKLPPAPEVDRRPSRPEPDVQPGVDQTVVEAERVAPGAEVQAMAPAGVDDAYLRLVQQKIGRSWQPTPASASGRSGVRVVLRFRILGSGRIADVMVMASSGLSVFDRQARSAVSSANPLPRPPARFGNDGIEITFHFVYNP